ncbi:MAG: rod-binding protein [Planctomycetota bacterium]
MRLDSIGGLGDLGSGGSKAGLAGLTQFEEARTRAQALGSESREALRTRLDAGGVEDVAREFESLFASMLVKEMRQTLPQGLFGDGPGADTYSGWFDQHVGRQLAESGVFDLAGVLRAGLPSEAPEVDDSALEEGEFVPFETPQAVPLTPDGPSFAPLPSDALVFTPLDPEPLR